jgi:hypothetical protein
MACVVDFKNSPAVLRCTICDRTSPFPLPMNTKQVAAITRRFQEQHGGCKRA